MIRKFIKLGFYSSLPLLIFTLLMKFKIINEIVDTNFLFPIVSVLFFIEIFYRTNIDQKKD
jgi:hypothetical protein